MMYRKITNCKQNTVLASAHDNAVSEVCYCWQWHCPHYHSQVNITLVSCLLKFTCWVGYLTRHGSFCIKKYLARLYVKLINFLIALLFKINIKTLQLCLCSSAVQLLSSGKKRLIKPAMFWLYSLTILSTLHNVYFTID